ncbi:hypothetical protein [Streptomyces sp. NPDC096033]
MRSLLNRLATVIARSRRPSARPVLVEPGGRAPLSSVMRAPHH